MCDAFSWGPCAAAKPGDTILVKPGTYSEHLVRDSEAAVQARLDELGEVAGFPDYAASNQPCGTPDQVARRLAEYAKVGVSEVIAVMPAPYDHETIERLATEVRPRIDQLLST
ncbi:MAG: hypothetical protein ACXVJW_08760 [Acidimicrobiia bacterium]